ncbi:MAG: sugar kinase [Sandaracinaceae bacterium]|jgi:sugar/nucleoside kinase (ribokinase family)|nr:sugar kinase [Sandaracinaceae bacterium]
MSSPLLVVGSVAFDTLHNPSGTHSRILGGSATYASLAASHFTKVRLVGVVGKDYPDSAIQMFRQHDIDLEGLEVDKSGDTFHWEGRYSDDLNSRTTLATDLNVFATFSPKIPAAFKSSPFVMLGNIDPVLQLEVLKQVEKPKLVVADTMNFWIGGKRDDLIKTLARVDVLVLNDEEARELSGKSALVTAARALFAMGPRVIVIKKGEHGAVLFEGSEIFSAPAYPTGEVIDPTGAGDTFAGGFIGYIASKGETSHATLRRAVVYGSALASYSVEGIGVDRVLTLTRDDIEKRYNIFRTLTSFHE